MIHPVRQAVSYTHLDVYKRQNLKCSFNFYADNLAVTVIALDVNLLTIFLTCPRHFFCRPIV